MGKYQYHVSCLEKTTIDAKKKTLRSSAVLLGEASPSKLACQCATERVQKLRCEYWQQIQDIELDNLVFLDETGVELGLTRRRARSPQGSRVYDLKPFYRGARITVIGAISCKKVVALITLNRSMDGQAFEVFVEKCLVPHLWEGAVVVMDNLTAHKQQFNCTFN